MKRLTTTLTTTAIAATSLVASSYINAAKVDIDAAAVGTQSTVWESVEATTVALYPQSTISFSDKKANATNKDNTAKTADVKAISDGKNVTFLIAWEDATYNSSKSKTSQSFFADGFAMQFSTTSDPKSLPYIGMGDDNRAVLVYLQKAINDVYEPNGHGDVAMQVNPRNTNVFGKDLEAFNQKVKESAKSKYQKAFIAKGFRSTTEIKDKSSEFLSNMRWDNGVWYATLSRALSDEYVSLEGAFPVAFAAWDGEKLNRDGLKHISGWTAVKLQGSNGGDELVSELTATPSGDAAKGQAEFEMHCTACHNTDTHKSASEFMAPNLANIGGYSSIAYLKESLMDASAVVVPGYNRNQHPNSPWYTLDGEGNRISTMPSYNWMSPEQIDDLVAYLKTLKREGN